MQDENGYYVKSKALRAIGGPYFVNNKQGDLVALYSCLRNNTWVLQNKHNWELISEKEANKLMAKMESILP